jgi:hypothetical protein
MPINDGYVGLLSFCSFAFSVIAAVLAIDLYALFRTGRSGATWRVLIIASVIFALMHVLRLAELLNFSAFRRTHLSEIVELIFVMALAYAFYLERRTFGRRERTGLHTPRQPRQAHSETNERDSDMLGEDEDSEEEESAASEWARLNGQADLPTRHKVQSLED